MFEVVIALKELAQAHAVVHETVAKHRMLIPEGQEDHIAILFCTCQIAEAYRRTAETYRAVRAGMGGEP